MWNTAAMIASAALGFGVSAAAALAADAPKVKSVVLVHGGFVDGSGWEGVYSILKKDGYDVTIVQNPTMSLADDVAATKRAIARCAGQVILVGHSYGGVVMYRSRQRSQGGRLVYITAFAPDAGESVASLIANPPPGAPVPPILPPVDGFLILIRRNLPIHSPRTSPEKAAFMANSQVPWGVAALNGAVTAPAWKTKPSWYLVATDDKMIPPPAQRKCQSAPAQRLKRPGQPRDLRSNPGAVADIIKQAAARSPKQAQTS